MWLRAWRVARCLFASTISGVTGGRSCSPSRRRTAAAPRQRRSAAGRRRRRPGDCLLLIRYDSRMDSAVSTSWWPEKRQIT